METARYLIPGLYLDSALWALGLLLALAGLWFLSTPAEKNKDLTALSFVIGVPLGLILSRGLFVAFDQGFAELWTVKNALNLRLGGMSLFGALLGGLLAATLSARLLRKPIIPWLNQVFPWLMLFVALARLSEAGTGLGLSRPLTESWLINSPLAHKGAFDSYLKTYLLEAVTAFALFVYLWLSARKRQRDVFLRGLFLFGLTQTLWESLRFDGHMRLSFTSVQYILASLCFGAVILIIVIDRQRHKRGKPWVNALYIAAVPLVFAALVGVEFMIDRANFPKWVSYAVYLAVLAVPAGIGLFVFRERN